MSLTFFDQAMVLVIAEAGAGEAANKVQDTDISFGFVFEHFLDGVIAVIHQSVHQLRSANQVTGFDNLRDVSCAVGFTQEINGMFDPKAGLFDEFLVFDPVLVTALFPVGQVLEIEAFTGFTEFVNNDAIGQSVIEHAVEHVAGLFGKAGDLAVAAGGWRWVQGADLRE